jgi:hypothetical protein
VATAAPTGNLPPNQLVLEDQMATEATVPQSIYCYFEPEVVENIVEALRGVLVTLGYPDAISDGQVDPLARMVIELAKAAEHDPDRLRVATLRALRH